jgi:hypothetical protein
MSNSKHAYGWAGHIIVSSDDNKSRPHDNVVAVDPDKFSKLFKDYENCELDPRVRIERLGVIDSDGVFLAAGCPESFSDGFTYYGTVFQEGELRQDGGELTADDDYLEAMDEIYGITLPECRLMIGCSSEH